ncbi:glycoside hydrolase family 32 protein, partial [Staphylococcus warneri]
MEEQNTLEVSNLRYRLGYHVMPKYGWINDPNGFSYFNGYYHIFYQYYPYAPEWGPMHWGHARSKDLVHWETLPIALEPGDEEDKNGCFSGTGIVKDDKLYLFYTGHHYYNDDDPDHFWQNQNMAYSEDGIHFQKYKQNAIIPTPPEDNTHHFRDPKVWEHHGYYYMIVGSQNDRELGRIILYRSEDLYEWEYLGP